MSRLDPDSLIPELIVPGPMLPESMVPDSKVPDSTALDLMFPDLAFPARLSELRRTKAHLRVTMTWMLQHIRTIVPLSREFERKEFLQQARIEEFHFHRRNLVSGVAGRWSSPLL